MELRTILSVKNGPELEFFPELSVRLVEGGILLRAKSPILAETIKGMGLKPANSDHLHRHWRDFPLCIPPSRSALSKVARVDWGLFVQEDQQAANLIWLTHPDLGKGFEIKIPAVVSVNEAENFFTLSCEGVRDFYLQTCRTAEFRAKLSEVFTGVV